MNTLTKKRIQALAEQLGYSISGGTKAELITSFLEAQTAATGSGQGG